MNLLYKILKQDPGSREGIITTTSVLNILMNLLVAGVKILIGFLTASLAIISEGINNLTDVMTSVLALLGSRLAKKHPDEKHPFGYGRVEYVASLVIATLIMVTGIELFKSSLELVFEKSSLSVSMISILILAITAIVKYALGTYTVKMGEKTESNSLIGVGSECKSDSYASIITIVSSAIFVFTGISVDAYAGMIIAGLIIKAGFDVLRETLGDILGRPGEHELALKLYKEIRSTEGIIAAVDMMLHNYGPDAWSGSVNVEMDHNMTVGEIYQILHELQLRIMHEYHVVMVFGVYAVDNDHENIKLLRYQINAFRKVHDHITSFHAVYIDSKTNTIYCDFIVDYALRDWDGLRAEFIRYMGELYPDYKVELVIETEFV